MSTHSAKLRRRKHHSTAFKNQLQGDGVLQKNAAAEYSRTKTLATLATTMLHDDKLLKSFWVDAMQTAAYITAHSSASGLHEKTPYKILFKRRVDPTLFRPFGCQGYALISKDKWQERFYSKGHKAIMIGYTHGKQAYKLLDIDDTAPWNTDPGTNQWRGLIPENVHYPDQNTMEDDDPDPNELQIEPHLQENVLQAIEPYQHQNITRAVGQYLHEDVLRAVGALEQLKHPQQQSLEPRPEHWPSLEQKPKVESQSVGAQLLNIQPADVEEVIQLDKQLYLLKSLEHAEAVAILVLQTKRTLDKKQSQKERHNIFMEKPNAPEVPEETSNTEETFFAGIASTGPSNTDLSRTLKEALLHPDGEL
ncbi:hypothetical protein SERLADRAFT_432494 [Serpula lacrymans var. lacrymans S7.9]|uniref:Integrase catalytic domain-containing protein n=1 Tax=Serpula lacrymans var. lacrymans (strain S7.9) TaxID=578457 RepID=F8NFH0_SERL9|nr:uncharacterized protein SERLADRAFT_432494 [Serpula lacrymans var. lacrymans S7.9]EGO30849.1 hypothetical protein SERLADRAFT_432494 [Serpula lacrymans var. lacrymans S7.9]